ncbi:MAG: phosphate ABC transporter permease subunit PstC [Candidatus Heimdallarchaeaceae archaeon]
MNTTLMTKDTSSESKRLESLTKLLSNNTIGSTFYVRKTLDSSIKVVLAIMTVSASLLTIFISLYLFIEALPVMGSIKIWSIFLEIIMFILTSFIALWTFFDKSTFSQKFRKQTIRNLAIIVEMLGVFLIVTLLIDYTTSKDILSLVSVTITIIFEFGILILLIHLFNSKTKKINQKYMKPLAFLLIFLVLSIFIFGIIEVIPEIYTLSEIKQLLFGQTWNPKKENFGAFNLFMGSMIVTFYAIIIVIPFGLSIGIFMAEFVPENLYKHLKSSIELISAIPSVIMGLISFKYFAKLIKSIFFALGVEQQYSVGNIALTASITLAFMTVPMIASLTDDALRSVPKELKKSALALGSSHWEVIARVSIPYNRSSISSAIILAFGRIFGETMVVLMVAGSNPALSKGLLNPLQGIYALPAAIALEVSDVVVDDPQWHALFYLGLELLTISFVITVLGRRIASGKLTFTSVKKLFKKGCSYLWNRLSKRKEEEIKYSENNNFARFTKDKFMHPKNKYFQSRPTSPSEEQLNTEYFETLMCSNSSILSKYKIRKQRIYTGIFTLLTFIVLGVLGLVFFSVGIDGFRNIDFQDIIPGKPSFSRMVQGHYGYLTSTIGSILVVGTAALIGLPISTAAGIYLTFYLKPTNKLGQMIKNGIQNIASVPSVVVGLFGWGIFVSTFGWGKSVLSGGFTLMIMMIPIVTSTTIEALNQVPNDFRQGSLALGSTKWESIKEHNLRYAFPSIITGYLFSISRVIGETAPIILTAAAARYAPTYFPSGLTNSAVAMLPFDIYEFGLYTDVIYPNSFSWAMTCALILLVIALGLFVFGQILRSKLQVKYD